MSSDYNDALGLFEAHRDCGSFTTSNQAEQARKLLEEVGEFVSAVWQGDITNAQEEAGDIAWLLVDMLNVLGADPYLDHAMEDVLAKLNRRWNSRVE